MTVGVYCITHRATGRKYVGQSVDIERRWYKHQHDKQHTWVTRRAKQERAA
jgi:predicted GIY-YIG superfamily endonuclease